MSYLITRQHVVSAEELIGSALAKIQNEVFDPQTLSLYEAESEKAEYLAQFDFIDLKQHESKQINKIIGIEHNDLTTFTEKLGLELKKLFELVGADELYILSHVKMDFFGNRKNNFDQLKSARKKLEKLTGENSYDQAFRIGLKELPDFIEILFWITRVDAVAPEIIYIFGLNGKIKLQLCRYGNIHLTELGEESLNDKLLISNGWTIIKGEEVDQFL